MSYEHFTTSTDAPGPDDRRPALSTIGCDDPAWQRLVADYRSASRTGGVRDHARLWRAARGREVLILNGAHDRSRRYRDLVFAVLLKAGYRLRGRTVPPVLLVDATWEPGSRALARSLPRLAPLLPALARAAVRALDGQHLRYVVLSTEERSRFAGTWGVDPDRVLFQPFPHTLWNLPNIAVSTGDYLWSGGNSLRDYDLLEEAVHGLDLDVRVHARWSPRRPDSPIRAATSPHEEFVRSLAGARAAVVPLWPAVRSAGQQTYLNAMALGKPVVVTQAPGVLDYIRPGETGIVVPPTPQALRAAILDVMDPANAARYARMGAAAREDVLHRFTEDTYRAGLLRHAGLLAPERA